jgi:hypothetical protein
MFYASVFVVVGSGRCEGGVGAGGSMWKRVVGELHHFLDYASLWDYANWLCSMSGIVYIGGARMGT